MGQQNSVLDVIKQNNMVQTCPKNIRQQMANNKWMPLGREEDQDLMDERNPGCNARERS
jgi:hypothetical protein